MRLNNNMLDYHSLECIYYAFFHSHLQYGLGVWGCMINNHLKSRIIKLPKRALKIIDNKKPDSKFSTDIDDLIKIELAKISFRYISDSLPIRLVRLFEHSTHNYETRNRSSPRSSLHSKTIYNNSYLCKAPSNWVTMSQHIKESTNLKTLVQRVKKSLR